MLKTPIIKTYNLSKNYNGTHALRDLNIELNEGEIISLVGANGAGKSTFVKLLYGEIEPSKGYFELRGKKIKFNSPKKAIENGVVKISQDFDLFNDLSIAENIYLYHTKKGKSLFYKSKNANKYAINTFSILNYNIDINRKIKELNVTEKQIVSIAKAISKNPELLILDEPTSVLDINGINTLFGILKEITKTGTSVIFISHKLEEVISISDRVAVLKDGIITLDSEITKTTKEDIVFAMHGQIEDVFSSITTKETKNKSISFLKIDDCSGKEFHNISFEMAKSEAVGLISENRQSIVNIVETIFGLNILKSGQLFINNEVVRINSPIYAIKKGIGYLPEDRRDEGLFYNMSLEDNMTINVKKENSTCGFVNKHLLESKVISISKKLNIVFSSLNQPISEISGGNQQKVLFARWLMQNIQLFLLVEPTAGVDIRSKLEIYNIIDDLKNEGKSFLVISSDRQELIKVCDRIIKISDGRIENIYRKSQYSIDEKILI